MPRACSGRLSSPVHISKTVAVATQVPTSDTPPATPPSPPAPPLPPSTPPCPDGWTPAPRESSWGEHKCYKFTQETSTQWGCSAICAAHGGGLGGLTCLANVNQSAFVKTVASAAGLEWSAYWIGLYQVPLSACTRTHAQAGKRACSPAHVCIDPARRASAPAAGLTRPCGPRPSAGSGKRGPHRGLAVVHRVRL